MQFSFFGYNAPKDALFGYCRRRAMTLRLSVTSCSNIVMLCYDVIRDVTRHMRQGYKRAWRHVVGDSLVQLSLGKEVHVRAWIDALACLR